MARNRGISPYGVVALLAGAVISTATTCGPPVREDPVVTDTGGWSSGGGTREPDAGFTVVDDGSFSLRGDGDVATVTVRATLSERCLREVPEYAWGYPTGWLVLAYGMAVTPDTGAPEDSGAAEDSADTGTADTATATPTDTADTDTDTAVTTDTGDTGWAVGADARVRLVVTEVDGSTLAERRVSLHDTTTLRDRVENDHPFAACARDATCDRAWTVTLTLVEGDAVDGTLDAHVRLNMCSSGDPVASDLTVAVE